MRILTAALALLLVSATARAQITITDPPNGSFVASHFEAKGRGNPTVIIVRDVHFEPAGFAAWSTTPGRWQAEVALYPWCPDVFWLVVANTNEVTIHTLYLGE